MLSSRKTYFIYKSFEQNQNTCILDEGGEMNVSLKKKIPNKNPAGLSNNIVIHTCVLSLNFDNTTFCGLFFF